MPSQDMHNAAIGGAPDTDTAVSTTCTAFALMLAKAETHA